MHMHTHTYIYIYIYIYRERGPLERDTEGERERERERLGVWGIGFMVEGPGLMVDGISGARMVHLGRSTCHTISGRRH